VWFARLKGKLESLAAQLWDKRMAERGRGTAAALLKSSTGPTRAGHG